MGPRARAGHSSREDIQPTPQVRQIRSDRILRNVFPVPPTSAKSWEKLQEKFFPSETLLEAGDEVRRYIRELKKEKQNKREKQ